MKPLVPFLVLATAVVGLLGFVGFSSSESEDALSPVENESRIDSSKGSALLLSPTDPMSVPENRRAEVSSSDLSVGHVFFEEREALLMKRYADLESRFEEQAVELDRALVLLSYYRAHRGESRMLEFLETPSSEEFDWLELERLDELFEKVGGFGFSDDQLKGYCEASLARAKETRSIEKRRYKVARGNSGHQRNVEFDKELEENAVDYRRQLRLLGFNESDVAKILGTDGVPPLIER